MREFEYYLKDGDFIPKIGEWYTVGKNGSPKIEHIVGRKVQIMTVKLYKETYGDMLFVEAYVCDAYGNEFYAPTNAVRSFYKEEGEKKKRGKKVIITTTIQEED